MRVYIIRPTTPLAQHIRYAYHLGAITLQPIPNLERLSIKARHKLMQVRNIPVPVMTSTLAPDRLDAPYLYIEPAYIWASGYWNTRTVETGIVKRQVLPHASRIREDVSEA